MSVANKLYRLSQIILSAYKLTLTVHGLSTEDTILTFESPGFENSWLPQKLKHQMVEMKIHSIIINIFWVLYIRSSQDILILIFCTSLGQHKVNVGCTCWTAVRRKLLFLKFSFQNFWSQNDFLCDKCRSRIPAGNSEGFNMKMEIPKARGH